MALQIPEWAKDCLGRLNICSLKEHQKTMLELLEKKVDFLAVLPTGYGKSLCYQVAGSVEGKPGVVLIVMPLVSLMRQQSQRMAEAGFPVAYVTNMVETQEALHSGINHIFTSPETLVSCIIPSLYDSKNVAQQISHVVVDETHCVVKWGYSDKRTSAFRTSYSEIGAIRSAVPHAVMIALTATATAATINIISKSLQLSDDFALIRESVNKPNIRYSVMTPQVDLPDLLHNLLNNYHMGKTLIFCRQFQHLGEIYHILRRKLEPGVVDKYHSKIPEAQQKQVLNQFCAVDSPLTIVVCTSSFSMGVDIPDIKTIIHYGISSSIDDFMQETGRAGRDGKQCYSIVINHKHSLKGNIVSQDCKKFVKSKACRRLNLSEMMNFDFNPISPAFLCCDICAELYSCCTCGSNSSRCKHASVKQCFCTGWCYSMSFMSKSQHCSKAIDSCREKGSAADEHMCLKQLQTLTQCESPALPQSVTSQIYPDLLSKIISQYIYIDNPTDIFNLGAYSMSSADRLYQVIDEFFPKTVVAFGSVAYASDSSDSNSDLEMDFQSDYAV